MKDAKDLRQLVGRLVHLNTTIYWNDRGWKDDSLKTFLFVALGENTTRCEGQTRSFVCAAADSREWYAGQFLTDAGLAWIRLTSLDVEAIDE